MGQSVMASFSALPGSRFAMLQRDLRCDKLIESDSDSCLLRPGGPIRCETT